jgi:DUF971 family protein
VTTSSPWPLDLSYNRAERILRVRFDDGVAFNLPAEYLRVESPSAEVKGHGAAERKTVPGKKWVAIQAIEPVGQYAVRLIFDDGHDTGLYAWSYLYELGQQHANRWAEYESRLSRLGLRRDP